MTDLIDIDQLKKFLHSQGLRPKDYLGQNFLADEGALAAILDNADLTGSDTVLEVGPGLGVLTEQLVRSAGEVWAVEKDEKLIPILRQRLASAKNLKIIREDILKFNLSEKIPGPYKVVANIPYYLTSKLFRYFLEQKNPPKLLILMVQKEVGERVVTMPGDLSVLGISVQISADAEIVRHVPRDSFWPSPEVDSVVLKITPGNKYPEIVDRQLFFRLVKIGFAGKRKQIHNTLAHGLRLDKTVISELLEAAGIDPATRPQDISIEKWIELYKVSAGKL